jgi:hypothetical protein
MGTLTQQEQDAIADWLSKNRPIKYPTGYSSIYDCYGNKRSTLKFKMAGYAKRIRTALKKNPDMTYEELSKQLLLSFDDVISVCRKHNIEVSG